jgi:integrase
MHLEQLPSGSWRVTVQHAGRKRRETRESKASARLAGAQLLLEMGGKPASDPTIQELVDAHLLEAKYAATTREQIERAYAHIPATFLARRAAEVTPVVVAALWREMAKVKVRRGRREYPLSLHTIKRAQDLLSMAWQRAQRYEWVTPASNPFTVVASPDPDDATEVNPPTPEQVKTLIGEARGRDLELWLRLAAVTGARRGELCGLRWTDLRLDRCELVIRNAATDRKGGGTGQSKTKTGRKGHRVIELDPRTVLALEAHPRHKGCPWVFTHDRINPWRPSYVTLEFSRLCARLGYDDIHTHSLRHFAATQWLAKGYSVADVAYLLGHATPATTLRVYLHYIPASAREAVSELAALLDA